VAGSDVARSLAFYHAVPGPLGLEQRDDIEQPGHFAFVPD
jgi:hypothetical protein